MTGLRGQVAFQSLLCPVPWRLRAQQEPVLAGVCQRGLGEGMTLLLQLPAVVFASPGYK